MALVNPVLSSHFNVFLFDTKKLEATFESLGTAALSLGVGVGKTILFGSFSEVSGIEAEMETQEYREGGRNSGPHVFVKHGRYGPLTFKRGVTFNTDIWDWYYQVLYGTKEPIRKNGVILLTDRGTGITALSDSGPTDLGLPVVDKLPVAAWFFSNGVPKKLSGPGLNGSGSEIAIETLQIEHESLVRIGPAMIPSIAGVPVGDFAASFGL